MQADGRIFEQNEIGRRNGKAAWVFDAVSFVVIPLYTLLFAARGGLLASNLSKTGNLPGNQLRFILWGVVCAASFHLLTNLLYRVPGFQSKPAKAMMRAACMLLTVTVLCPFQPDRYPVFSAMHDTAAKAAATMTVLSTLLLSIDVKRVDTIAHRKAMLLWAGHFLICLFLLLKTGTSGLTEAMFISTASFQLFWLMRWVGGSRQAQAAEAYGMQAAQDA